MKKGFTLIELLVVVLIIGILSAVALPQYTKIVERSRAAEAKLMLKSMADAQSVCMLEQGDIQACKMGKFFENSSFTPPTSVLPSSDDLCVDGLDCFVTKDWTYWSEDWLYAGRIKAGEWVYTLRFPSSDEENQIPDCRNEGDVDYCKMIGMESNF